MRHEYHVMHGAAPLPDSMAPPLLATALHTAAYLLATAHLALVVCHKVGLRLLRTAWITLDLVWVVALVLTGVATAVLG
jgi:hypothetical protein